MRKHDRCTDALITFFLHDLFIKIWEFHLVLILVYVWYILCNGGAEIANLLIGTFSSFSTFSNEYFKVYIGYQFNIGTCASVTRPVSLTKGYF